VVNRIAPRVVPENPARKAVVAQLVEQLIRNQQVTGSSPVNGSKEFSKLRREERFSGRSFSLLTAILTATRRETD
jgi:hypothetical protein